MKNRILFILVYLFLIINCSNGQLKPLKWVFGDKGGLDFTTTPPSKLLGNPTKSEEGNVTITDDQGNILLFVVGNTIYNKNFVAMKNGTGLFGNTNTSSAQSPAILQDPGNSNLLYVFYISEHVGDFVGDLRYSVVNLCGDSGNGEVIENKKNIKIPGYYTERMTIVPSNKEGEYWLLTVPSSGYKINAFKINAMGINLNPVVSDLNFSGNPPQIGMLNANKQFNKLAFTTSFNSETGLYLIDFDNSNGFASNFTSKYVANCYDATFSPSGRFLYFNDFFATSKLLKYDLLLDEVKELYSNDNNYELLGIEEGPDGNIYCGIKSTSSICQIKNIDSENEIVNLDFIQTTGYSVTQNISYFYGFNGLKQDTLSYQICNGNSVSINGLTYDSSGVYVQELLTNSGCDSLLTIIVDESNSTSTNVNYNLCDGENVTVNNIVYSSTGEYTQTIQSNTGCDSILHISIVVEEKKSTTINKIICSNDSLVINNISYKDSGTYFQNFVSSSGCDSTLIINLKVNNVKSNSLKYEICRGEKITINNIEYNISGNYLQNLVTFEGCDSILSIQLTVLEHTERELFYQLCNNEVIEINGIEYSAEGQYVQKLKAKNGCDSILVINVSACNNSIWYDFEKCNANNGPESMNFSEFIPTYINMTNCGAIKASNVYRLDPGANKHSCTQGVDNSIAMCISSNSSNTFVSGSKTSIYFDIEVIPNSQDNLSLTNLNFYHKGPTNFNWINGASGLNNYPTKFGIRILKDGIEILKINDIDTKINWEKYNLNLDPTLFSVNKTTKFTFEIQPYKLINNGSAMSAWDIDNLIINTECKISNKRQFAGKINSIDTKAIIYKKSSLGDLEIEESDDSGNFKFINNDETNSYVIGVKKEDEVLKGVNTKDIILIQKHILGITPFTNSKSLIASDINNDGKISVTDIVELRKTILGFQTKFKKNDSYIFYDSKKSPELSNINTIRDIQIMPSAQNLNDINFNSIKIGDVDESSSNFASIIENRSIRNENIIIESIIEKESNIYELNIKLQTPNIIGLDCKFDLGGMKLLGLLSTNATDFSSNNYFVDIKNHLHISWNDIYYSSNILNIRITVQANNIDELYSLKIADDNESQLFTNTDYVILNNIIFDEILNNSPDLSLAPNPFANTLLIKIKNRDDLAENRTTQFSVTDVNGKLVHIQQFFGEEVIVDLSKLKSGLYFVTLNNKVYKLIKSE